MEPIQIFSVKKSARVKSETRWLGEEGRRRVGGGGEG
jgi:hypothetical protein